MIKTKEKNMFSVISYNTEQKCSMFNNPYPANKNRFSIISCNTVQKCSILNNAYPANSFFVLKILRLLFTSAAYIQVHLKPDFYHGIKCTLSSLGGQQNHN